MNREWKHAAGLVIVVGAVLLAGGCASTGSSSTPASSATADASVLKQLDDAWSAAAATRDPAKVGAFYAENAIAFPPNAPAAVGKQAATQVWAAYFAEPSLSISWKSNDARISACGGLGFTSGSYKLSLKGPDGAMINDTGKFLCVWEKQADGSWKAIRDMWNSDLK